MDVDARPPVSPAKQLVDEALRVFVDQMRPTYLRRLRDQDLTPPMAATLRLLADGPVPLGLVAEHHDCDASTVTWIADRLEERGLAAREPDPADRRVRRLAITEAGHDRLAAVDASMADAFPGIDRLTEAEQLLLAKLLRRAFA